MQTGPRQARRLASAIRRWPLHLGFARSAAASVGHRTPTPLRLKGRQGSAPSLWTPTAIDLGSQPSGRLCPAVGAGRHRSATKDTRDHVASSRASRRSGAAAGKSTGQPSNSTTRSGTRAAQTRQHWADCLFGRASARTSRSGGASSAFLSAWRKLRPLLGTIPPCCLEHRHGCSPRQLAAHPLAVRLQRRTRLPFAAPRPLSGLLAT